MGHYSYDADTRMDSEGAGRDNKGNRKKSIMLGHIISLLQALVGILDIISGSSENKQ